MDMAAFVRHVAEHLRCNEPRAEAVTFVVLHALRARLPETEIADLRAQLPTGLKRMWDESHGRLDAPKPGRHALDLIGHVRQQAGLPDDHEAERAVRAVFRALQTLLGSPTGMEGEAWDVFSVLPKDWQKLWISSALTSEPTS